MISYKIAKQLKDAGFPQNSDEWLDDPECGGCGKILKHEQCNVSDPTLSELIEACGDKFAELGRGDSAVDAQWTASGFPIKIGFAGQGDTPEEAVAKLWFLLNKK